MSDRSPAAADSYSAPRNFFARATAATTFVLVFAGGLVTSTGSALAVPDWPLAFGQFFPPMVGGVLYEHGHRMIAGVVAILTAVQALWLGRTDPRPAVRRLAVVALVVVLTQALLGGITVLFLLPTAVSVSHACLAQAFFCIVVALALFTGRSWLGAGKRRAPAESVGLFHRAATTTAVVYGQLVLGAVMRHTGAGLAIPDFPLAFGRLVPELDSAAIAIHFAHRVGAIVVTAAVVWTAAAALRRHRDEPLLARPAMLLVALVAVQILLGGSIVWTGKAVFPTTAHVATGAAILATSLVLALRADRMIERSDVVTAPSGATAAMRTFS